MDKRISEFEEGTLSPSDYFISSRGTGNFKINLAAPISGLSGFVVNLNSTLNSLNDSFSSITGSLNLISGNLNTNGAAISILSGQIVGNLASIQLISGNLDSLSSSFSTLSGTLPSSISAALLTGVPFILNTGVSPFINSALSTGIYTNSGAIKLINDTLATGAPRSPLEVVANRPINGTPFLVSATRDAFVSYSVLIGTTVAFLAGGASGALTLEKTSNGTNWTGISTVKNLQTATLAVGLTLAQNVGGTLAGYFPKGHSGRIRQSMAVGSPTFSWETGQECLL